MKKPQLTLSFPEKETGIKRELMRMKVEEQLNVSAFVLDCLEKELGYVEKIISPAGA